MQKAGVLSSDKKNREMAIAKIVEQDRATQRRNALKKAVKDGAKIHPR